MQSAQCILIPLHSPSESNLAITTPSSSISGSAQCLLNKDLLRTPAAQGATSYTGEALAAMRASLNGGTPQITHE